MKSITYARLTLLLPYFILIKPIIDFINKYYYSNVGSLAESINFWFLFSAIFWLLPYTIMVIGLLVWSRGKSIEQIRVVYLFSPNYLAIIAPAAFIIAWIISLIVMRDWDKAIGLGIILGIAAVVSIPASFIIGYFFVGVSLLFYKLLQKIKMIRD